MGTGEEPTRANSNSLCCSVTLDRWTKQEKMICRMLLLLILISSVCAATFVVNVTQSSYQAEENHNITLEWTFTTKPDVSWRFLFIICNLITDHRVLTLYHVHDGVEVPESRHEKFAGRVQSDKDVLREGRIRLHVSRLRTNDSGLYVCDVKTDYGLSSEKCQLNVTGELREKTTFYQAEEDDNITIRWDSQNQTYMFLTNIICFLLSTSEKVFYKLIDGVELPESQHQQFSGRVQCDRDALREGRVTLHLSRVTAEDSGSYWCEMNNYNKKLRRWELQAEFNFVLNVTPRPHKESTTSGPIPVEAAEKPKDKTSPGTILLLLLPSVVLFVVHIYVAVKNHRSSRNKPPTPISCILYSDEQNTLRTAPDV
ncbi:uncharacterized protein LOC121639774 isoform X1 [Melanotaenia boesemani]|uniref:uncharacterized protein LOC121639774 isoform X1 n=2 Tax=Melanotaenia boesemani TaxID=1250792 RepID=UPI001C04C860|nr:uncharacterized protein LOC121639774 isoform X1 [Melanotaenia boesemani]XP_041841193.1 uncharacterized protein LOC121639774 isoform X1 [Melanotaenia boesemani]